MKTKTDSEESSVIRPYVVVVGVDFSEYGGRALRDAIGLAGQNRGELHVVHAVLRQGENVLLDSSSGMHRTTMEGAAKQLNDYVANALSLEAAQRPHLTLSGVVAHVRAGRPAEEVAAMAAELDADMVVVGTHGRSGVKRWLLGSVAEKVTRLAPCQVVIARPKQHVQSQPDVPEVEPPCQDCVAERQATAREQLWCSRHRRSLGRRHTYHYVSRNASARENMPLVSPSRNSATNAISG